jgi:hypothetical protein
MANPQCSRESLIDNGACFSGSVLPSNKQKALKIYFMAKQLAAIGGTNYIGNLTTTLIDDSKCKTQLSPSQFDVARITIEKNNAAAAGASISSNTQDWMADIACLETATPIQLKAAELHLRCELGYGHAYPQ